MEVVGCDLAADQPYGMASPVVHNGAICKREGDLLHITTPAERLAYSVELQPARMLRWSNP